LIDNLCFQKDSNEFVDVISYKIYYLYVRGGGFILERGLDRGLFFGLRRILYEL
jgi:hypothetical protein